MALGFLRSFDRRIDVRSAGTMPGTEVNRKAVMVMSEEGIDIGREVPEPVEKYLGDQWDYVITVCDDANEACPFFSGKVKHRLHIGFEDPSKAVGTEEFVMSEFRRVRDEIKSAFLEFFNKEIVRKLG